MKLTIELAAVGAFLGAAFYVDWLASIVGLAVGATCFFLGWDLGRRDA